MRSKLEIYIEKRLHDRLVAECREKVKKGSSYDVIKKDLLKKGHSRGLVNLVLKKSGYSFWKMHFGMLLKKQEIHKIQTSPITDDKHVENKSVKGLNLIRGYPKISIAVLMVILFFIALGVNILANTSERGNGSCPLVSLSDVRKAASFHQEVRDVLTYEETDELVGAYLGKEDCRIIDSRTLEKIREAKLSG